MAFKREREERPDGARVTVWRSGRYRCWKDDDVDHGPWAASHEHLGSEEILGHADTKAGARQLCVEHAKGAET
ncbi:MAG: hypothetical protein ACODAB_09775 [Gemmatimonadota bacterium]